MDRLSSIAEVIPNYAHLYINRKFITNQGITLSK